MNKEPYYEKGKMTGKEYNLWDVIRILNPKQAAFYCSKGLEIKEIELSEDRKTKEPILVYFFNKEETKEPFDEWCKRKEERNGGYDEPLGNIDDNNGDRQ